MEKFKNYTVQAHLTLATLLSAVGFGVNHHCELARDVYSEAVVVVDNMPGALHELKGLVDSGVTLHGELGAVIRQVTSLPNTPFTVFHSMGMYFLLMHHNI